MEKVRIQDNLFMNVNGEWYENATIPSDKPATGSFNHLDEELEKLMINEFKEFSEGKLTTDIKEMKEAVKLYNKIMDIDTRNKLGISPGMPILNKIKAMKSVDDLNKNLKEFLIFKAAIPFRLSVDADFNDSTKYALCMMGLGTILPDTTYYQNEQVAQQLFAIYSQMASFALSKTDLSKEEQEQYLKDTLEVDKNLAKIVKSRVEWADITKMNNPMPIEEVQKCLGNIDFTGLLKEVLVDKVPNQLIVLDKRFVLEFKEFFKENEFEKYVHYAYVTALLRASNALSIELADNASSFMRALMGIQEVPALDKQAYHIASTIFGEPVGVYYGRKYFGEEAKKDVVALVHKIIDTYKERVNNNTFLEDATKKEAIKKLSTIAVKMGYPDKINEKYSKYIVEEKDSFFESLQKLNILAFNDEVAKLGTTVDRSEWVMPGHVVNACYNPSVNDITFPAAILQKPFYSLKQSVFENLGGIGAVIAHEISHAFDNNGSHFDENGNIANWWTEKDFAEFDKLTKEMIKQWDKIPFRGGFVNGELVVSENIADNGGMAVTIEICHTYPNPDFKAYFKNWARVWAFKASDQYYQLLLVNDVHSPCELRCNIQVRNFKEWYEAFDVKETDEMFIPEDKRIIIW